jgi:hypothetical protein
MIQPSIHRQRRAAAGLAGLTFCLAGAAWAAPAAPQPARTPLADQLHALAVQSFQQGRFPEAYGRFVALADAGHAASARKALWMCEHGPAHFGREWDCAPHQVQGWSAVAGIATPRWPANEGLAPGQAAGHGRRR